MTRNGAVVIYFAEEAWNQARTSLLIAFVIGKIEGTAFVWGFAHVGYCHFYFHLLCGLLIERRVPYEKCDLFCLSPPPLEQSSTSQPARTAKWLHYFNPLNAESNPIRHLLALVGARHFVHVNRLRVNFNTFYLRSYQTDTRLHRLYQEYYTSCAKRWVYFN